MSTSGFGHSGPYKAYRSFGPTAAAQSGLSLASGLPGMPPAGWGFSYMDVMGGWMEDSPSSCALLQARKTGQGSYVDLRGHRGREIVAARHVHARISR